jgi:predicted component of type VI protein secretion system
VKELEEIIDLRDQLAHLEQFLHETEIGDDDS